MSFHEPLHRFLPALRPQELWSVVRRGVGLRLPRRQSVNYKSVNYKSV